MSRLAVSLRQLDASSVRFTIGLNRDKQFVAAISIADFHNFDTSSSLVPPRKLGGVNGWFLLVGVAVIESLLLLTGKKDWAIAESKVLAGDWMPENCGK